MCQWRLSKQYDIIMMSTYIDQWHLSKQHVFVPRRSHTWHGWPTHDRGRVAAAGRRREIAEGPQAKGIKNCLQWRQHRVLLLHPSYFHQEGEGRRGFLSQQISHTVHYSFPIGRRGGRRFTSQQISHTVLYVPWIPRETWATRIAAHLWGDAGS